MVIKDARDIDIEKRRRLFKEEMEWEIDRRSLFSDGEEFPADDVVKTLEQLNLIDKPKYRYDNSRDATQ